MDIILSDEQDDPAPIDVVAEVAEAAMQAESLPDSTQLAISLVDEVRMAALNDEYMNKTGPTDVLSFPIEDFSAGIVPPETDGPPLMLGDIFICPSVVHANALSTAVRFDDEMALMVVHGILHLLGHDHVIDEEAESMEQREREILGMVGRQRP